MAAESGLVAIVKMEGAKAYPWQRKLEAEAPAFVCTRCRGRRILVMNTLFEQEYDKIQCCGHHCAAADRSLAGREGSIFMRGVFSAVGRV